MFKGTIRGFGSDFEYICFRVMIITTCPTKRSEHIHRPWCYVHICIANVSRERGKRREGERERRREV